MKHRIKQLILFLCTLVFIGNISVASADTASDTERLLNWAENNYPQYFSTQQTTQSFESWLFRFYPDTDVYVGVDVSNNGVYVFGGPWGNASPTYIDSLSNLLPVAQNGKLADVVSIFRSTFGSSSFALKNDGTVWAWGVNTSGQLGDGTTINRLAPIKVVGMNNVTNVVSHLSNTIALKNDGTVWFWGNNAHGDLGDGTSSTGPFSPIQISGLADINAIGKGDLGNNYAIKNDGTIWEWGTFSTQCSPCLPPPQPMQINGLTNVIDIEVVLNRVSDVDGVFILKSDGTVWTWGDTYINNDGSTAYRGPEDSIQVSGLSGVTKIDIFRIEGSANVYALKGDGTVWAWGDIGDLEGGRKTTDGIITPVQIMGLTGITDIVTNKEFKLALKNDGTVWAWGVNTGGQLGDGTTIDRSIPVQVVGLTDIIRIESNLLSSSYALKADGTVWSWGTSIWGGIGNGDGDINELFITSIPVQVGGLVGISDIVTGSLGSSILALKNNGTVWGWGLNTFGNLGDGTTATLRNKPVQVINP